MRRRRFNNWRTLTGAVIWIAALVCFEPSPVFAAEPAASTNAAFRPTIHWTPDRIGSRHYFVEVTLPDIGALNALRTAAPTNWPDVLSVYAGAHRPLEEIGLPPMAGRYTVEDHGIRFTPRFPFEPGVTYRAVLHGDRLAGRTSAASLLATSEFHLPLARRAPSTELSHIHPSSGLLPENLLKFYLHFSAPMSGGHVYQHIHLLNEDGREVDLPFLELDEELWNPEMTRLTLFIDPGRIKREVRPLEEIGPALEEGKRYTLVIDQAWPDATGVRLATSHEKSFRVGPPDRTPPDPRQWIVAPPTAGTRAPLVVGFGEPLDHALALRLIQVIDADGRILPGSASLADQENRWQFEPETPWPAGALDVLVQPTIEDLAGNNIGKPFEVDLAEGGRPRSLGKPVRITVGAH